MGVHKMPIKRYEISDYQWNQIKHLFPTAKTGRPPKDNRMVFNAIENLSIDSTLVKALQHSAGAKKGRQDTKPASRLGKAVAGTQPKSIPPKSNTLNS